MIDLIALAIAWYSARSIKDAPITVEQKPWVKAYILLLVAYIVKDIPEFLELFS